MKIRSDFVTNSSSSSFVVARKGPLNETLREAAVNYVVKRLLGDVVTDPEKLPIDPDDPDILPEISSKAKELMDEGWTVSGHTYELGADAELANMYYGAWMTLKRADPKSFKAVDVDLSY